MTRHSTTKTMISVGAYRTRSDSELAQMLLWAAGIPYETRAGGARLLVDQADAADAATLLFN